VVKCFRFSAFHSIASIARSMIAMGGGSTGEQRDWRPWIRLAQPFDEAPPRWCHIRRLFPKQPLAPWTVLTVMIGMLIILAGLWQPVANTHDNGRDAFRPRTRHRAPTGKRLHS
jgi:hypothetical protein